MKIKFKKTYRHTYGSGSYDDNFDVYADGKEVFGIYLRKIVEKGFRTSYMVRWYSNWDKIGTHPELMKLYESKGMTAGVCEILHSLDRTKKFISKMIKLRNVA